jgi:NTP pyrophosphatase (non-canonical NTP hydrolase)
MRTLNEVSVTNVDRCRVWHPGGLAEWSLLEWAGAMCGEAGEAANEAKKIKRVDSGIVGSDATPRDELVAKLRKEIGDTYLYLDLLAQAAGLTLEECVVDAFNKTSEKQGFPHRL